MIRYEIPNYPELSVKHVWPLVMENQDLLDYFPDYKPSQQPEKEFMYSVLSTLKPDEVWTLVASSLKHRAPALQDDKADLIEATHELNEVITQLYSMKSKWTWNQIFIICIATKGRANYLLKKSSILNSQRKSPMKYEADLSQFVNYSHGIPPREEEKKEEENRGEDDMQ